MMELIENQTSRVALSVGEVDALLDHVPELKLVPALGAPGHYDVTPIEPGVHVIRNSGKWLHVLRLNLNVGPSQILKGVEELAGAIRAGVAAAA